MPAQKLTCSCGYSWSHAGSAPVPADVRQICPLCSPHADHSTVALQAGTDTGESSEKPRKQIELEPGTELAGFEILEEMNRGGMGVIYKARQLGLNRLVALKIIIPDRIGQADAMKRFQREVQAAALLSHPNIVTVFHTDLSGPWPYLAMEYVPGIDLFRLVKQVGPLSFNDTSAYVQQAAHGLQHAYERGLVHRDIKPHNLMVMPSPLDPPPSGSARRSPTVKILDMGLARVQAVGDHEGGEGLTQAGEFLGTPDYISPEQAEDPRLADTRADLYSLGATWYFLLTGEVPFPGANLMQKLRRQLTHPVPVVTERRADTPPALAAIIRKLMEKDASQRFQTPAELVDAIGNLSRHPSQTIATAAARDASTPVTVPSPSQSGPLKVLAHDRGVQAICLSGDGQTVVTGGDDETLRVWDATRLRELRSVSADVGPVRGLAIVPSARWGASCALRLFEDDMVVQLWDLSSGAEKRRLKGPTKNVTCVSIASDGRKVTGGSEDRTIRLWTLDPPNVPVVTMKGHTGPVTGVLLLPDGLLLSVSLDGTMRQWDVKTGQSKGGIQTQAGPLRGVAFGGTSKRVALVGDLLRLRQANGTLLTLPGHRGQPLCAAFSADGALLASGGADHTVRLWRANDGQELACFEGHAGPVRSVVFSPDARWLYSGSGDGTLRRWAVPQGTT